MNDQEKIKKIDEALAKFMARTKEIRDEYGREIKKILGDIKNRKAGEARKKLGI